MNKILCWWKWRTKNRARALRLMDAVSTRALECILARSTYKTIEEKNKINKLIERCHKHFLWAERVYRGRSPFRAGEK